MAVTQADVDALDAAQLAIATGAQEYTLPNGFTVKKANLADIGKLRNQWQAEVLAAAAGGAFVPVVFVRE